MTTLFLDIPFADREEGNFGAGNKPAARNTSDLFSVELDGLYGRQATVVSVKFVGSWNWQKMCFADRFPRSFPAHSDSPPPAAPSRRFLWQKSPGHWEKVDAERKSSRCLVHYEPLLTTIVVFVNRSLLCKLYSVSWCSRGEWWVSLGPLHSFTSVFFPERPAARLWLNFAYSINNFLKKSWTFSKITIRR